MRLWHGAGLHFVSRFAVEEDPESQIDDRVLILIADFLNQSLYPQSIGRLIADYFRDNHTLQSL